MVRYHWKLFVKESIFGRLLDETSVKLLPKPVTCWHKSLWVLATDLMGLRKDYVLGLNKPFVTGTCYPPTGGNLSELSVTYLRN